MDVTTLFSDMKLPVAGQTYFKIDLLEANNFYPFGMSEFGLHYTAPSFNYRYSFNGMEKDDDVKGLGNSYTTEFRMYDDRLAGGRAKTRKFMNLKVLMFQWGINQ